VAIVTGSSDGIGYAVARALAREGARLVLCARRENLLAEARETIVKETGTDVLAVSCDVQRLGDVENLVKQTLQRFGVIHILVNNAGSVPSAKFADVDDAQWYQMLEGKLLAYLRMTREVVPHMVKTGWGRIVNVAGTAGWEPSNTAMAVGLKQCRGDQLDQVFISRSCGGRHPRDDRCPRLDRNAASGSQPPARGEYHRQEFR
jgi:NAD(P)-dependent dehydrogenase (short-subunit alcohol dehydrogenase family)